MLTLLFSLVAGYEHLVVTVHGFSGLATDLGYVQRRLEFEKDIVVLAVTCNQGRTWDGVAAGGRRVAREVAAFAAQRPELKTLSFIGNSMGGLYSRYALAELSTDLVQAAFVTTAAPHLGVGMAAYGTIAAGVPFATARDLTGQTDLLEDLMAPRFLDPLRRFQVRRAYAAATGDFMVPFESALFTKSKPPIERRTTTVVECGGVADDPPNALAAELDALGWTKCVVSLAHEPGSFLPLAHNKVVALERAGIKSLYAPFESTAVGRPAMDDLARWLADAVRQAAASSSDAACTEPEQ